jgi:hypothetical protein
VSRTHVLHVSVSYDGGQTYRELRRQQIRARGAQLGGLIAGPFIGPLGPLGGSVVGLLVGLMTAGAEEEKIMSQIKLEQEKDQQLEAAIEQELERQSELEQQIARESAASGPSESVARPTPDPGSTASLDAETSEATQTEAPTNLAALRKPSGPSTTAPPFKNVEVRDIDGDGIPDLWIYYNPQKPGEIVRQEEASKGDGQVDTWTYFKDGKVVRREVDSTGRGRPDRVYYYDGDNIAREEHDETGDGRITYRAIYQDGRLANVEKDTTRRGKPDLWVYYDTTKDIEVIIREERDLNGNGLPDLWSHYENGRLVRRDVNASGLEVLSKEEQVPAPPEDFNVISAPLAQ